MNTKFPVITRTKSEPVNQEQGDEVRTPGFLINFIFAKSAVIRGSMEPVFVKPFIVFAAALVNFEQMPRHFIRSRTIRLERSRSCYFAVPILRPDSVGVAESRRPGNHRFAKLDTDCLAK